MSDEQNYVSVLYKLSTFHWLKFFMIVFCSYFAVFFAYFRRIFKNIFSHAEQISQVCTSFNTFSLFQSDVAFCICSLNFAVSPTAHIYSIRFDVYATCLASLQIFWEEEIIVWSYCIKISVEHGCFDKCHTNSQRQSDSSLTRLPIFMAFIGNDCKRFQRGLQHA